LRGGGGISAAKDLLREAAEEDVDAAGVDPRRSPSAAASGAEPCLRRECAESLSPSDDESGGCCAAVGAEESPGVAEGRLNSPPPEDVIATRWQQLWQCAETTEQERRGAVLLSEDELNQC